MQAVLETIRALMNAECVVPDWLHDTFLGYGDPSAASYTRYCASEDVLYTACVSFMYKVDQVVEDECVYVEYQHCKWSYHYERSWESKRS